MTFTFNNNIPAANNNPSDDQPKMLQNNQTAPLALAVDHVSFNDPDCGKHKQVTFVSENEPGAQTDPASTLYTGAGSASTNAQTFFRNEDGIFMVTPIRAFGLFTTSSGGNTLDNGYNVVSILENAGRTSITITLETNAVTGDDVQVFFSQSNSRSVNYTFTNPVLTVTPDQATFTNGVKFSFVVLQA